MTTQEWRDFLNQWSEEWLATDEFFPSKVKKNRWLGFEPATAKQIIDLENKLGYSLPPSYRNFLLTTNGWRRTSTSIQRLRPIREVQWLEIDDPQLLDAWNETDPPDQLSSYDPEEYFAYDGRPIFDREHLRKTLIIADPVAGDSMIYLLNPLVVAQDGEWEAWRFAHWIPGAERFPSFAVLMRSEHESFLNSSAATNKITFGPYAGPYAPGAPRHQAERLGPRLKKPRRLTIPELIAQLESPERKMRLAAAKQLFREFMDDEEKHPEIVEPLSRILKGKLEPTVRCAAADILGRYANASAIPPLLDALEDKGVKACAISALFHLSINIKDSRIANAVVHLLNEPQNYFVIQQALYILEELEDPRVAAIGLRLLDGDMKLAFDFPKNLPDVDKAEQLQTSEFRFAGAFAYAKFAENPTDVLVARLTHSNADIRTAAVAALREDKGLDIHLAKFVKPLLNDPDENVRYQATMTLRSLEPFIPVEISPEQVRMIEQDCLSQLQRATNRKKRLKRFGNPPA